MRFFVWLLNAGARHHFGIRRYEKGGMGIRIITILVALLFIGASLGLEYWLFTSLQDREAFGGGGAKIVILILIGILFVATAGATIEYCAIFSLTAFRMAIYGVACSRAKRKQLAEAQAAAESAGAGDPVDTGKYKGFDIFHGFLQIAFIIGLIGGVIALASVLL